MLHSTKVIYAIFVAILAVAAGAYGYWLKADGVSSEPSSSSERIRSADVLEDQPKAETSKQTTTISGSSDSGDDRNHLANATSPYLLMHADNPVHWYPWGKQAFAQARKQNKPIFLSVGYSTCYWCHVMERESFMAEEVARVLNQNFVNIKVDREERPDVDQIYMNALQMMGQRGGWPMSMFLTPELKPFVGGTYFPKSHFLQILERINEAWTSKRASVVDYADELSSGLKRIEFMPVADKVPDSQPIKTVTQELHDTFDSVHGGFGNAPKFPQPAKLEFLLTQYQQTGDRVALGMVTQTLDAMARGGMYDQIGRGFHRYSTDDYWSVPHFEKMLYDNAQLMHTYARAYAITGETRYRRIALEISQYVDRVMTGSEEMFYSAMDSETDHEEGAYYIWTRDQIRQLLTDREYEIAKTVYGLDSEPFFEGKYVLQWSDSYDATARKLGLSTTDLFERLEPIRDKLLEARLQREQPLIDNKVIVAWNGLMIWALAYTGEKLDQPQLIERARRAADALWQTLRRDQTLKHVYRDGTVKLDAYLDDYAAFTLALFELHTVTGEQRWLKRAGQLADEMIARLWDADGAFFYTQESESSEDLLIRTKGGFDGAVPSGNSLAVTALSRLLAAGQERYLAYLAGTFRAYAARLQQYPIALVTMTEGLSRYHAADKPRQIALPNVTIDNLQAFAGNDALPASGNPDGGKLPKSDQYVNIQAELKQVTVDQYQLDTILKVSDGWHINANPASLDFLIPTTIRAEIDGKPVTPTVDYPAGHELEAGLDKPITVYSGITHIPVRVAASAGHTEQLRILARVQACNDQGRCLLPATVTTSVSTTR